MRKGGPIPKPLSVLEKRGSSQVYRRKQELKGSPKPPRCPKYLDTNERVLFKRVLVLLNGMNYASATDENIITRYAINLNLYIKYHEFIKINGEVCDVKDDLGRLVGRRQYIESKLLRQTQSELLTLEKHLGFTPAARASLIAPPDPSASEGKDDKFFR